MLTVLRAARYLLSGAAVICSISSVFSAEYSLTVDGSTTQGTVPHFWSRCVGTGGADLCLRDDWKNAARIGVEEAGFKAFRGHGILHTITTIFWDGSGEPVYDWTDFDRIYDFLVDSLGTVPVVELSFMPKDLQSVPGDVRSPPKDYNVWGDYISALVSHCIERYGRERVREWMWEVWNEYDFIGFWSGTEEEYHQLYRYAAQGAKRADSLIQIGGPATTNIHYGQLDRFLDFCRTNNVPLDLIANHCYGDGALIAGPGPTADPLIVRNDNRMRAEAIRNFGRDLLSLNTEYTTSYSGPGGKIGANTFSMDSHVNAPFVVKCVKLLLDDHTAGTYRAPDVLSYWVISDIFDEGSYIENNGFIPFAQVFGLISYHGVRKATFNGFKMLHAMGTTRLAMTGNGNPEADGVDGFATVNDDTTEVAVIIYNFYKELGGQTESDKVNLTVSNLPFTGGQVVVTHYRVDSLHSNAYTVWQQQGKPASPSDEEWEAMHAASELAVLTSDTIDNNGVAYTASFSLPRQGVSLLKFTWDPPTAIDRAEAKSGRPPFSFSGTNIISGGRQLTVSLFGLDGRLITTRSIRSPMLDLNNIAENRGIGIVRIQSEGKTETIRYLNMR